MAHKHRCEEHTNHEAWAIPYGDLITLLLAFFVVMYAVSVVDAGKYRVLSNSLVEAFGSQIPLDPIQVGDPSLASNLAADNIKRLLVPIENATSPTDVAVENSLEAVDNAERARILKEVKEMSQEIESSLGGLINDDKIQVTRKAYWLEITINSSLLFSSGSATLEAAAKPALESVAAILAKRDARIHVEGHTDNLPIKNPIYPSNWELSSGRAATVVNLFAQNGVNPERMVAIGYAEFQPVTNNDSENGRAQNRRVSIIVLPAPLQVSSETKIEPERLRSDYYEPDVGQIR
ncbi:flagellar motor protein MotD [Chromatium okenii]|uniref:flagellar motor protein MotD n=1 Tax=Chromatium okenii TaxID=61644 RepID=UPI0026F0A986|nr:flagellar motor protein MotD [Chromatium okenii]MBV5308620.1 flagellar motor protein MotD [Chromatium okenii]